MGVRAWKVVGIARGQEKYGLMTTGNPYYAATALESN
jgi:hypothetical protein